MPRGRTARVLATRVDAHGQRAAQPDEIVAEEPMQIRLDDHLVTTTMRTPGHDYELAVGFCFTEGLLAGAEVHVVRYCATGSAGPARSAMETDFNIVTVSTDNHAPPPTARLTTTTSSCGICGTESIDLLLERLAPRAAAIPDIRPAVLTQVAETVRARQALFEQTGSIHAAATFDPASGQVSLVREDIGRHNAVDKVVGRLALDDALPPSEQGLWVSGRVSFEIVQKAWAAGFALIAAVGGASSLAVETADAAHIGLAAFARKDTATVYVPRPDLA